MRLIKPLFILFIICLFNSHLLAQKTLASKKKNGAPVDLSSLHAKHIKHSTSLGNARSVTPNAITTIRNFNSTLPTPHRILHTDDHALPTFIETKRNFIASHLFASKDLKANCKDYLKELKLLLAIDDPEENFIIERYKTDNNKITHVRMQQHYKSIPVYGAEIALHLNAAGEGETFNGRYLQIPKDLNVIPTISNQSVIERVKMHAAKSFEYPELTSSQKRLVQYAAPKLTLCIYEDQGLIKTPTLAYHIVYCPSISTRWEYFVDAHTNAVLHHFNSSCSVDGPRTASASDLNGVSRSVNTYQAGATFFMIDASRFMFNATNSVMPDDPVGGVFTIDLNNTFGTNQAYDHVTSTNNVWSNPTAISAHFNAGTAYEYYRTQHNRNGIDDVGGTIISIINTPDEDGTALDNAYWNGAAMFYGNGKVAFKKLAGSLDVAGHELTHGVVQNTANLEYQGESGAINESMADIFGCMMDPADWLIGEDIVKTTSFPSGALRSLSDPHNGGQNLGDRGYQPARVSEAYKGSQDNGGVHINSGITNNAFYRFAQATTNVKASAVFYKALADYLTKSSKFIDLRLAVIKAAGDLYGTSSNEVTQAGIAFDAVGIVSAPGGDYTETIPANPGSEFLLIYNTDPNEANSLYRLAGANAIPISTTGLRNKPSVTDDGSVAVFVAGDNTIHMIVTDPKDTPQETVLQADRIWSNVVISKGGNRLAAVTTAEDKIIHVYDFTTEIWASFELYNPTFSEGVISGGPLYADALEWDYSGEYLVYDAFNSITNSSGDNIEYWDVNFIHLWDIASQDFSDGEISKLFASLPDGVSIIDPSYSKTSPNIIAFDYYDANNDEFKVLGVNVETNDISTIVLNNSLGWPSFNKDDSRISFTSDNGNGNDKTSYVNLNSDKISSNGVTFNILDLSRWSVYYSIGDRGVGEDEVTGVKDDGQNKLSLSCYPNPFSDQLLLELNQNFTNGGKVEIVNLLGQRILDFTVGHETDKSLSLKVNNLPPAQYILHIKNGYGVGACKAVKIK